METVYHPVKTFTCRYDAKEDRLLLTLNYQYIEHRIDFWITRSFLMKLIPIFFDYTTYSNEQIILPLLAGIQQSETDTSTYLLTQRKPLLLESVDFQSINDNTRVVLKNLERVLFYEAILDKQTMQDFVKLILKSVPKYEWGIYNI